MNDASHTTQAGAPRVGIVIVNWNGLHDTLECLESLRNLEYSNYCVIVVDNASSDGSVHKIEECYPEHVVLQAGSNRGLAAGANIGIGRVLENGADYVLLLNNDTRVDPKFLTRMVAACESDPSVGLTGGRIVYMSVPDKVWACGGTFNVNTGQAKHFFSDKEFRAFVPGGVWCTYMPACLLLIRRQCIQEIGPLSERFFHLAEDVEYCVRAARKGWRLELAPNAMVFHKGSSSMARFSPLYNYYEQRNRLYVVRQYRIQTKSVCANIADYLIILTRLTFALVTIDRLGHFFEGAWFLLLAVYDFVRGRDGKYEDDSGNHALPAI
jgi:GT2 family glycosyltransferase